MIMYGVDNALRVPFYGVVRSFNGRHPNKAQDTHVRGDITCGAPFIEEYCQIRY